MTSFLYHTVWYLQPVLELALAAFFFRRKLHLRFPLFFSLVTYVFVTDLVLLGAHTFGYKTYFYAYWSINAVAVILSFAVIYELFTTMFGQHHGLKDFGSTLFQWAGVVVALMALLMLSTGAGIKVKLIAAIIMNVQRAVMVMQVGLLLMLMFFMKHLGITVRHRVFGVILGFGTKATVELIILTQRARLGFGDTTLNIIYMATFDVTLAIWLIYSFLKEPVAVMPNMLLKPQRWNDDLLHASAPAAGETVLLGIESIVDRALTKGNGDGLKNSLRKTF
jgi:hypothetical protein